MKILVDYDGTLIKTKEEDFTKLYFSSLSKFVKMNPKYLGNLIFEITKDLIKNQKGNKSIYKQFIEQLVSQTDKSEKEWEKIFTEYYTSEFKTLKNHVIANKALINAIKESKNDIIFASNPLFPRIAIEERLNFINMKTTDFQYVSVMENSYWLKPNPLFFSDILQFINAKPEECIMIGDTDFDRSCEKVGIKFINVLNEKEWKKLL